MTRRGFYLPISLISFCRVHDISGMRHVEACRVLSVRVPATAATLPPVCLRSWVVGRDRPPKVRHSKLIRNLRASHISYSSPDSLLPTHLDDMGAFLVINQVAPRDRGRVRCRCRVHRQCSRRCILRRLLLVLLLLPNDRQHLGLIQR